MHNDNLATIGGRISYGDLVYSLCGEDGRTERGWALRMARTHEEDRAEPAGGIARQAVSSDYFV
jgi:hypothetical protein